MPARPRSAGQSMVEFVIIAPVMLVLVLGIFQFALLYRAKATLNLATFEAARAGAVGEAQFESIRYGFARSMSALYIKQSEYNNAFDLDVAGAKTVHPVKKGAVALAARTLRSHGLQEARLRVLDEFGGTSTAQGTRNGAGFICAERVNPRKGAFRDFALSPSGSSDPKGSIPNDNLPFRDAVPGSASTLSIQDANLLKIRITYCHKLIVPLIDRIITASPVFQDLQFFSRNPDVVGVTGVGAFRQKCLDDGRLPIVAQAIVRMQSPAKYDAEFDRPKDFCD